LDMSSLRVAHQLGPSSPPRVSEVAWSVGGRLRADGVRAAKFRVLSCGSTSSPPLRRPGPDPGTRTGRPPPSQGKHLAVRMSSVASETPRPQVVLIPDALPTINRDFQIVRMAAPRAPNKLLHARGCPANGGSST